MVEIDKSEYAVERALYPLIKLLIDSGVSFGEFRNVAKRAFCKVAADKLSDEERLQRQKVAELIAAIVEQRSAETGGSEKPLSPEQREELSTELAGSKRYVTLVRKLLRRFGLSELTRSLVVDSLPSPTKLSDSRISVLTGVPRKEVNGLLNSCPAESGSEMQWYNHRCNKILSSWFSLPDYTEADGSPKPIRVSLSSSSEKSTRREASFEKLVAMVDGDLSHQMVLQELVSAGSVVEEGDLVRAVRSRFERHGISVDALVDAAERFYAFGEALNRRLRSSSESQLSEGQILELSPVLRRRSITVKDLRKLAEGLLSSSQRIVSRHSDAQSEPSSSTRIGVGVYVVDGDEMSESEHFVSLSDLGLKDSEVG